LFEKINEIEDEYAWRVNVVLLNPGLLNRIDPKVQNKVGHWPCLFFSRKQCNNQHEASKNVVHPIHFLFDRTSIQARNVF